MATEFALAGLGLVILLLAGDVLVKGAVNLSLRLGIPALIVSLTIVAFGTSAPELLISIKSILDGVPGLALGNVVGSNTANILLVLGVPAIISGLHAASDTRRTYVMMIAGTVLFIALAFVGPFTWWHGLILLSLLAYVLFDAARSAQAHRAEANGAPVEDDLEEADPDMPWWRIGLYLLLGLIGLPLGADLLVDSSVDHRHGVRRQRRRDRPDAGGHRHVAAGAGDNRDGRDPQTGRCGAGQRDRVEHVQPACDHRHLHASSGRSRWIANSEVRSSGSCWRPRWCWRLSSFSAGQDMGRGVGVLSSRRSMSATS
jgi:hypothetical protein